MNRSIYSVKDVNTYIKRRLEGDADLHDIWIKGEISNFTLQKSGHMYFSLKEPNNVLKAVMFKGYAGGLRFVPKSGLKVLVRGSIVVYEPTGQYQVQVQEMQPDGIGGLHLAFEQLKEKLNNEGLFDAQYKQSLPLYPKTIGVITSPTGAVIHDIVTTLKRRYPIAKIILLPVMVQGEKAPASIVKAIETMNAYGNVDVMIVGRGGGSIEDLWAFNDEQVARAIFASSIPIVSAVGHETDVTIADFVADLRAPTPTGAAELVASISVAELTEQMDHVQRLLKKELLNQLKHKQHRLEKQTNQLLFHHPQKKMERHMQQVDQLTESLTKQMEKILTSKQNRWMVQTAKLDGLSPLKVMSKGYNLTYVNDELVKDVEQVRIGDKVDIHVTNGTLECVVENIKGEKR